MKKCFLCVQPAEAQAPWDLEWDKKCAESICDLLTLEHAEYLIFFENVAYCRPCHEFIRDIDFTVRTLTLFKEKALELRTILAQKLLPHLETWSSPESGHQDKCSYIDTTANTNESSTAMKKSAEPEILGGRAVEGSDSDVSHHQELLLEFNQIPIEIDVKEEETQNADSRSECQSDSSNNQRNSAFVSESEWPETPEYKSFQYAEIVTILDLKNEDEDAIESGGAQLPNSKSLALHTGKYHEDKAKEYFCSVCGVSFRFNSVRKTHEELHKPDSFICVLGRCRRNFLRQPHRVPDHGSAETLRAHVKEKHPAEKLFKCEKCPVTCTTRTRVVVHRQHLHPAIGKNICGINGCTFESDSSDWLNVHKTQHQISSEDGATPCSVCHINFTKESLESHMCRVHCPSTGLQTQIQCPACSKTFGNGKVQRNEFRKFLMHFHGLHVSRDPETGTRGFPFVCPVGDCLSRARTKELLAAHICKFHENEAKPFKCDKCSQSFTVRNLLRRHLSRCHGCPVAVCHLCEKGFSAPSFLNYHISNKHPDAQKYPCDICGAKFHFIIDCKAHEDLHQPESFICVLAKCYYFNKDRVRKDYGSVENLREHVEEEHQYHQYGKGKVLYCDKCTFMCRNQHFLNKHMSKHSKEKPFQCKTCLKCFKSKYALGDHEENKHPDPNNVKVYKCKLCPDTFHSRQLMAKHLFRRRHGSITKPLPKKRQVQGGEGF